MVYTEDNEYKLRKEAIVYTRGDEEYTQVVVEGRQWWIDFEAKWEDMAIVEFKDIAYTDEQLQRFEEIKDIDANEDLLSEYVMSGEARGELEILAIKQLMADLTETVLLGGK